jgi:hypothetical protein
MVQDTMTCRHMILKALADSASSISLKVLRYYWQEHRRGVSMNDLADTPVGEVVSTTKNVYEQLKVLEDKGFVIRTCSTEINEYRPGRKAPRQVNRYIITPSGLDKLNIIIKETQ